MTYASVSTITAAIVPPSVCRTRIWPSNRGATTAAEGLKKPRGSGTKFGNEDVPIAGEQLIGGKKLQQQIWSHAETDHGGGHEDDGESGGPGRLNRSGVTREDVNLFQDLQIVVEGDSTHGDGEDDKPEEREVFALGESGGEDVKDRKSTRLNSSHLVISYAVFC